MPAAALPIPDDAPYATYSVVGSTTGPFAVPFPLPTDYEGALKVSVDDAELLPAAFVFTPDSAVDGGYPTGEIELVAAVANATVKVWRDTPITRTADYGAGPLDFVAFNAELARLTMQVQDGRHVASRLIDSWREDASGVSIHAALAPFVQSSSLSAAEQLLRRDRKVFKPEWYGASADGSGSAEENEAVQNCMNAAQAAGGTVLLSRKYRLGPTYGSGFPLVIPGSGFAIQGMGPHTGFTGAGATAIQMLTFPALITADTSKTLTSSVAKRSRVLPLNNVTGLSVGSILAITATIGGISYFLMTRVTDIASLNVTVQHALPWALATGDTYFIQRITNTLSRVVLDNFVFDKGANAHSDTSGLYARWMLDCVCSRIYTADMPYSGVQAFYGLDNTFDIHALRSGSGAAGAVQLNFQTGARGVLESHQATGFGIVINQSEYFDFSALRSVGANGRGVKLAGSMGHVNFAEAIASGFTGFGFSDGSRDCVVDALSSFGNGNEGLWSNGVGNTGNYVGSYRSGANAAGAFGIYGANVDELVVDNYEGTETAPSTLNAGLCTIRPVRRVRFRADRNNTALSIPDGTGSATRAPMTTVRLDTDTNWDNSNGRFLCKWPGVYRITVHATMASVPTDLYVELQINGATNAYARRVDYGASVTFEARLAAGDYVDLAVTQSSGGAINLLGAPTATFVQVEQC